MNTIEQLEVSGSHREIGRNIGHHLAGTIHCFFDNYIFLQQQLLPFLKRSTGRRLFQSYLKLHQIRFPQYIAELAGMAEGSERPFDDLLAVNLREGSLQVCSHPGIKRSIQPMQTFRAVPTAWS
jgi:hypothetical protein